MFTKKEIIEMYYSDQPDKIDETLINIMVKKLSDDKLISEFNRKSKGSSIKISRYINGYIPVFELDFFELTENVILRLNTSSENLHYHNNKDISRAEMRYRLLHNIDL